MCMDYGMEQEYVNYLLGAVCTLLGWLLHSMWEAVKDLQAADKQLTNKVAAIEVLVAGKYVTRYDFNEVMVRVESKLDSISAKIDTKADK